MADSVEDELDEVVGPEDLTAGAKDEVDEDDEMELRTADLTTEHQPPDQR